MKIIRGIEKFFDVVSVINGIIIVALVVMVCIDVVMRSMGSGITGSVEITISSVPVVGALSIGFCMMKEQHIRVDVIRIWPHMDRVTNILCIVFILIIAYYSLDYMSQVQMLGTSSQILRIPRWPLLVITSFGLFSTVLALIVNEIKAYMKILNKRKNKEDSDSKKEMEGIS